MAPKRHRQRPLRLQVLARLVRRRRGLRPASPRLFQEDEQDREAARAQKAISSRVNAGEVYLIDPITLDKPKTKDLLAKLKDELRQEDHARSSSSRSPTRTSTSPRGTIPHLETVTGDLVNAEQLLLYDKIFITDGALGKLSARLQK